MGTRGLDKFIHGNPSNPSPRKIPKKLVADESAFNGHRYANVEEVRLIRPRKKVRIADRFSRPLIQDLGKEHSIQTLGAIQIHQQTLLSNSSWYLANHGHIVYLGSMLHQIPFQMSRLVHTETPEVPFHLIELQQM